MIAPEAILEIGLASLSYIATMYTNKAYFISCFSKEEKTIYDYNKSFHNPINIVRLT